MIDLEKFTEYLYQCNDLDETQKIKEYQELVGILTGNKTCTERATLESLAYYIEYLEDILWIYDNRRDITIDLNSLPAVSPVMRRGI